MKIQIIPILLTIFLTACAPVAIAVPSAEAAVTLTPTPILEATATAMARPTATENPLAGAPDETATGKDAKGNWIRPATNPDGTPLLDSKGKQVFETWYTFPSGPSGETLSGWFEDHIKEGTLNGGIPVVDKTAQTKSGLPIYFMVKDGIKAKFLQHIPGTGMDPGVNYNGNALYTLISRYYQKPISQVSSSEMENFGKIWPNNFSINLTDAQGKPRTIYGDTSFTIVLVGPEDIPTPDFVLGRATSPISNYFTFFDESSHSVKILVSTTKPFDQYTNKEMMDIILDQIGHILVFSDLNPKLWGADPGKAAQATSLANMALKGNIPYFIISDTP